MNTITPLVSITTCFYNLENVIQETLESVAAQSYTNWEWILIDDGSSDKTTAIVKAFASRYPDKVFCYHHADYANKGVSYSRNVALGYTKGDFITFIDGDDTWLPGYLQHQVNLFNHNPDAGMIVEATEYWYSWNDKTKSDTIKPIGVPPGKYYSPDLCMKLYPLGEGAAPCICAAMIRRSVIERVGVFNPAFSGMFEDQVFFTKIYLWEVIVVSNACNNRYRQRPGSLVNSSNYDHYRTTKKQYLLWLQEYMQQKGLNNTSIQSSILHHLKYKRPILVRVKNFTKQKLLMFADK